MAGLLLVCFSVFLGHNLVPHHHHSEVFNSPITTDCPFDHGDHQGHDHKRDASAEADEHPVHCHAFNGVVFEKYTITINKPDTSQPLAMEVPAHAYELDVPQGLNSGLFILLKLPNKSHTDLGTRALRGPPALA